MGFYDKTDAKTAPEGVWFTPNRNYDFSGCYNATEAFEQALFVGDTMVGNLLQGFTTFPPEGTKPFGVTYRVRRIADVDEIVNRRQAKRQAAAVAREQAKTN